MREVIAIVGVALATAGCWAHAPQVNVGTPGVEISGADGSFRVRAGQPIATPFESLKCNYRPANVATEHWREALEKGGKPVVVTTPALQQPLFGVLQLCMLAQGAAGPWQREYLLQLPDKYVNETTESRVSVVYEVYPPDHPVGFAWVLWLSRSPLVPTAATAAKPETSPTATPSAATGAAAPARGQLVIVTTPTGAHLRIDGADAGVSPTRVDAIPGEHLVDATWDDGTSKSGVGTVAAGASAVVQIQK
jgi:hypothetical protein